MKKVYKTVYMELKEKEAKCLKQAQRAKDGYMKTFWLNASKGFDKKARSLPMYEAIKPV